MRCPRPEDPRSSKKTAHSLNANVWATRRLSGVSSQVSTNLGTAETGVGSRVSSQADHKSSASL